MSACPTCGVAALVLHCTKEQSHTCDWFVCRECKSYGKRDGSRWHDARFDTR